MLKKCVAVGLAVFLTVALGGSDCLAAEADRHGLVGRLIVGYQGWFGCPSDFVEDAGWQHWFVDGVQPRNLTVDLLPSVRGLDTRDLCDTGLKKADGERVYLFSAQNARVVSTHFRWMREHGIDGAAVQRFAVNLPNSKKRERSNNVLRNVMTAAVENGRVFFIVYDVSGADTKNVADDIRNDWRYLSKNLKLTDNPAYLFDHGKPVLELWGFGFSDHPGTPESISALIKDLKLGGDGVPAVTLIGGVPTNWRSLTKDSKTDPGWAAVYRSYDVISPWSVGRFGDDAGADDFLRSHVIPDLTETRRLGIGYMPVIFPGFSWYNLMTNRNRPSQAILNQIPRRCGKFFWRQVSNLLQAGVTSVYAAMFDEVDEGTALFPVETRPDKLPVGAKMVYLNQDGCALPDDWYLRVTGKAAEYLRNRQTPPSQLEKAIVP